MKQVWNGKRLDEDNRNGTDSFRVYTAGPGVGEVMPLQGSMRHKATYDSHLEISLRMQKRVPA